MNSPALATGLLAACVLLSYGALGASPGEPAPPEAGPFEPFKPESSASTGTVTVGGQAIAY